MRRAFLAPVVAAAFLLSCRQAPPPPATLTQPPPLPGPHDVRVASSSFPDWLLAIRAADPDLVRGTGPGGAVLLLRSRVTGDADGVVGRWASGVEYRGEPRPLDFDGGTLRAGTGTIDGVAMQLAVVDLRGPGARHAVGVIAVPAANRDGGQVMLQEAPKLADLAKETEDAWGGVDIVVVKMYVTPGQPLRRDLVTVHVVAYNRGDKAGTGQIEIFGFRNMREMAPPFPPKPITLAPGKTGEVTWSFVAEDAAYQFNGTPRSRHFDSSVHFVVVTPDEVPTPSPLPTPTPAPTPTPVPPPPRFRVIALMVPLPLKVGQTAVLGAVVANDTGAQATRTVVGRVDGSTGPFELYRFDEVTLPGGDQQLLSYVWTAKRAGSYTFSSGEMSMTISVEP